MRLRNAIETHCLVYGSFLDIASLTMLTIVCRAFSVKVGHAATMRAKSAAADSPTSPVSLSTASDSAARAEVKIRNPFASQ